MRAAMRARTHVPDIPWRTIAIMVRTIATESHKTSFNNSKADALLGSRLNHHLTRITSSASSASSQKGAPNLCSTRGVSRGPQVGYKRIQNCRIQNIANVIMILKMMSNHV